MPHSRGHTPNHRLRGTLATWTTILPSLALLFTFVYLPVAWAVVSSFMEFEIGSEAKFVGFRHYAEYLTRDPTLWPSLFNMLVLTLLMVIIRLTSPLLVAKLIYEVRQERWRYIYRIVFLAPVLVPGVAVQLIWLQMIYADAGMINQLLELTGLANLATGWLSNPSTALVSIAAVGFPWVGGFEVLIYYAGLSAIPESVTEAAALEGCQGARKFFSIDIPMILSQIKLILILTIIAGVQGFQNILILTRGGPGFKTLVPGLWMYYNAFSFQRMGYACAIGVLLFMVIFGLTMLNMKYFRSSEELQTT